MAATAQTVEISRAQLGQLDDAWQILQEYFDAVGVVVRDSRESIISHFQDALSGIWLAFANGELAGCIALRPLNTDSSAEVKRLYVKPQYRRLGIAGELLSSLEAHALTIGVHYLYLYLDSKDDLVEAIAFYQRAGYQSCARYNSNPQATRFMKKTLRPTVAVRDFLPGDEEAFWLLNDAWISKLFKLEPKDIQILRDPQTYIFSKGGHIYMACRADQAIGCCALLKMNNGDFEVAKMGVAESERGQGVGRALLDYAIADARRLGLKRLYLETNHKLRNAIHLYESVGFRHLKPEEITPSPYARADVFMQMLL